MENSRPNSSEKRKARENDQDTYHFQWDDKLGREKWLHFRHFHRFKKLVFFNPKVAAQIDEYRQEYGVSPVSGMRISQKFTEFMQDKYKHHSKDQQELLTLFKKINENNEIYMYVEERMKDSNLTQKQLAESCFSTPDTIRTYTKMIIADQEYRKETEGSVSDERTKENLKSDRSIAYWDEFVAMYPWSRDPFERYKQFIEYLEEKHLYQEDEEKRIFQQQLLLTMQKINTEEIQNFYYYHRYHQAMKQKDIGKVLYSTSSRSYFVKMNYTEEKAEIVQEKDFENLQSFLDIVKEMEGSELFNHRNLVEEYKQGSNRRPIYDKKVIHPSFIEFVKSHEEFKGIKDKDAERLIYHARQKIANYGKEQNKKEEKVSEESVVVQKNVTKIRKKIMTAERLESIIKRQSKEENIKLIENYLTFLRTITTDSQIQGYWSDFYDQKSPFHNRMSTFALFLEEKYLYIKDTTQTELLQCIMEVNTREELNKYIVYLRQKGLTFNDISRKLHYSDTPVSNVLKNSNLDIQVKPEEVVHMERFLKLLDKNLIREYKKDYCKPRHNSIYYSGKILPRFETFISERAEFQDKKVIRENVEKIIPVLRKIDENKEIDTLVRILGDDTNLSQVDIAKALLIGRRKVHGFFKDRLTDEKFKKRFDHDLRFNNTYHTYFEYLMTKVFVEHPELGQIYQEPLLFKPENLNHPDSLIIASEMLQKRLQSILGVKNARYILLDYTNKYTDEYLLEKMAKYAPNQDSVLLIMGINWLWNKDEMAIPETDLFELDHPERVKIINSKKLARILNLPMHENAENWNLISSLSKARKMEEIEDFIDGLERFKELGKYTTELLIDLQVNGELENGQSLMSKFGKFDPEKIDEILLALKQARDMKPEILRVLRSGAHLLENIQDKIEGAAKYIRYSINSMEKKGMICTQMSHKEDGSVIKWHYLPEHEPPMDPYDAKRDEIVKMYEQNVSHERIYEEVGVSPKFTVKTLEERNVGKRPSLFRSKADFCYKAIRYKWKKQFLFVILQTKQFQNLQKLVSYSKDGRTYFDEKNPLKQNEIVIDGKPIHATLILTPIRSVNRRLKSIYFNLAEEILEHKGLKIDLKDWCMKYMKNPNDKLSDDYTVEEYWTDFQKYILNDVLENPQEYYNKLKGEDLIDYNRKRRQSQHPGSIQSKIVYWIKKNPNISDNQLKIKLKILLEKGEIDCMESSFRNIVKNAREFFKRGEYKTLSQRLSEFMDTLTEEDINRIDVKYLKTIPEFATYVNDSLRTTWNSLIRERKKKL